MMTKIHTDLMAYSFAEMVKNARDSGDADGLRGINRAVSAFCDVAETFNDDFDRAGFKVVVSGD